MHYSEFRALDLHVHTPGSVDVHGEFAQASPQDIVDRSLQAGLDGIAITDHNTASWVDAVRGAAEGTSLTVFPGLEISTREGHLLGIFEPYEDSQRLADLLVRLGFDTEDHGRVDAQAPLGIDDAAREVRNHGGVAIAAHISKPKGFWAYTDGNRQRRAEIVRSRTIDAFEITSIDEVADYEQLRSEQDPTCLVLNSDSWEPGGDSHTLAGIGSKRTYFKLGEFSMNALRQAMKDPDLRVRLDPDSVLAPSYHIESMKVRSSFFPDEEFVFSPDITCLLGGTGTGKSLVLELIRFCLDQQPNETDFPAIRREVDERLAFALAELGSAQIWIQKDGVRYLVERAMRDGVATDPAVSRIDGEELQPLPGVAVDEMFRVRAFSQSEVIEYARRPMARLGLLDGLLDLAQVRAKEEEAVSELALNATRICEATRELRAADEKLEALPGVVRRIGELSGLFDEGDVETYEAWQAERVFLERLEAASGVSDEGSGQELEGEEAAAPELPSKVLNEELLAGARASLEALLARRGEAQQSIVDAELAAATQISKAKATWKKLFDDYNTQLQQSLVEANLEEGGGLPSVRAQLTRLQDSRAGLRELEREREEVLLPTYENAMQRRHELLDEISLARKKIRNARRQKARELTELMGGSVRIRVEKYRETGNYSDALMVLKRGSRLQDQFIEEVATRCHPIPMVFSLIEGDFESLSQRVSDSEDRFRRLREHVLEDEGRLQAVLGLQSLNIDDGVSIQFAVGDEEYRSIEALAHGQKCTAVLLVALSQGSDPLLVDQPEDALHAPWIEQYIVRRLRDARGARQCLFATRSPNVVVSSDSEQVITLDATSNMGKIVRSGSLDSLETTDLVVHHVEGGRSPFARRVTKYGFDHD